MAHWAELDENNVVLRVTVGDNNEPDEGYQWLIDNLGGRWVQTSYNKTIRKNFAGIGFTYDAVRDAFIPSKESNSWVLDEDTCQWKPPIAYPTDGKDYRWDEATLSWVEVELPA
jgi:hypothetical protein